MLAKPLPSYETVRDLLNYDPETGIVTWRKSEWHRFVGREAGWLEKSSGYRRVEFDGGRWFIHRLIWVWQTGEEPRFIDHIDLDRTNNKWANLRECAKSENAANKLKQSNNRSGFKGVFWDSREKKWCAAIQKDGVRHRLGHFANKMDAVAVYQAKAIELFGDFARFE